MSWSKDYVDSDFQNRELREGKPNFLALCPHPVPVPALPRDTGLSAFNTEPHCVCTLVRLAQVAITRGRTQRAGKGDSCLIHGPRASPEACPGGT